MDLSFDLINRSGDQIKIALSDYDEKNIKIFTSNPEILKLKFYNITLSREENKTNYLNPTILFTVCGILRRFLEANENAVLTFYCDNKTDIERNHLNIPPQEYRSILFSKLVDYTLSKYNIEDVLHKVVVFKDFENAWNNQYFHIITKEKYKPQINEISELLFEK